jgi:hypothetical protein
MGGGLMQLVAYGAQDIYLTGNPQITFFKVVYRRHTNFSMESIEQTFNGVSTSNGRPVCTISRNGDLVHKIYLVQTRTSKQIKENITKPENIIKNVELEIGGQLIDRQSIEWMNTWNELSTPYSKYSGLKCMQGLNSSNFANRVNNIRIPLLFWFCRHPGLALPLIALQYHEVVIKLNMGDYGSVDPGFNLYCDYIYLDTDERRRFAQVSHEYLIEQIQEQTIVEKNNKLYFNHPVKEIIWETINRVGNVQFKLNGHDRFSEREHEYFELQQPYDYHTSIPNMNLPDAQSNGVIHESLSSTPPLATPVNSQDISALDGQPANSTNIPDNTFSAVFVRDETSSSHHHTTEPLPSDVNVEGPQHQLSGADEHGLLMNASTAAALNLSASNINKTFRITYIDGTTSDHEIIETTLKGYRQGGYTGTTEANKINSDLYLVSFNDFSDLYKGRARQSFSDGHGGISIISIEEIDIHSAPASSNTSKSINHISVYSFALKPEEHQPSGTCNFSRIDNAELIFSNNVSSGKIFAVNYNVLRIMSGMGGLAYSN